MDRLTEKAREAYLAALTQPLSVVLSGQSPVTPYDHTPWNEMLRDSFLHLIARKRSEKEGYPSDVLAAAARTWLSDAAQYLHRSDPAALLILVRGLQMYGTSPINASVPEVAAAPEMVRTCLAWMIQETENDTFYGVAHDVIKPCGDAEITPVLLELYHFDEQARMSENQGEVPDFNEFDELPHDSGSSTPREYLADLMATVVAARLIKRYGGELLRAWAEITYPQ
ncbi:MULTISPECIES: hypothetical protein [unclassified Frankia]|uniref:hypothetical protein n=1 Tax=unclassified Frankia TaxID=2632575 RepID=UPI0008D8FA55|nr:MULTISPECIES: hypothetical protein [unclassified Frankia]OHV48516.1 hypothetical protein CgIS1_05765 [Frankia sp. CgIS1]